MKQQHVYAAYVVATTALVFAGVVQGWAGVASLLVASLLVGWIAYWGSREDRAEADRRTKALAERVDSLQADLNRLKMQIGLRG